METTTVLNGVPRIPGSTRFTDRPGRTKKELRLIRKYIRQSIKKKDYSDKAVADQLNESGLLRYRIEAANVQKQRTARLNVKFRKMGKRKKFTRVVRATTNEYAKQLQSIAGSLLQIARAFEADTVRMAKIEAMCKEVAGR